ncbi:hypothetical protein N7532_000991 [Penicillium argentinense]|uniref:Uncharacterized protein n=1 Tax=Penicillium argentinense TaxID=1131581 RepID=A0A9W9G1N1_9EURO|nr:uncharacterized protein N7532_000991 [Penicillium argentinense]KAJ5110456.1 hypothetical protein N7532_000991 [Penicillium argentinense]
MAGPHGSMARPTVRQNATLGLSLVLFTFMFLPTFLVLLAVVVFFILAYPKLRKTYLEIMGLEEESVDDEK